MKRAIVLLALSLITARASAQDWTQVTFPFSGSGGNLTPYFLNESVGFTFNASNYYSGNTTNLARTTNGGQTWSYIRYFDTLGNWTGTSAGTSITQLCFVSLNHGYASTLVNGYSPIVAGGVFETTDQGSHWKKIIPDGMNFAGVYAARNMIFAQEETAGSYSNPGGAILFSRDGGATWDSIKKVSGVTLNLQPQFMGIYGNRDSLVATVYFTSGSFSQPDIYLVYSTNLGKSWQSKLLDQSYQGGTVALHLLPHSCNILRQHLNDMDLGYNHDTYSFLRASPPYSNWDSTLDHLETGAWIAGNSCAMYVSYGGASYLPPIERSTDAGISWYGIGSSSYGTGPSFNEIDDGDWQNISVVGHGAVAYAAAVNGTLWKTTDGGDGSLNSAALAPRLAWGHGPFATGTNTLQMSVCAPASLIVYYENLACSITKLNSISIAGLAPSEYTYTSTDHNTCESLSDTTFITIKPATPGVHDLTVHAQFVDDEFNVIDTTMIVTLDVLSGTGATLPLRMYLKPNDTTVTPGDTVEIPVYLTSSDGAVTIAGATSMFVPFALNTEVLTPVEFKPWIPGVAVSGVMGWSLTAAGVNLKAPTGLSFTGEVLLGKLRAVAYVSESSRTNVTLSNASVASKDPRCLALSLNTDSVNVLVHACGSTTLITFMETGKLTLAIESITPNPAISSVGVTFRNPQNEAISYQVSDALGAVRMEGESVRDRVELDVQALPSGLYYLRARGATGFATSRRFMVER